jgi:hypothetical protein
MRAILSIHVQPDNGGGGARGNGAESRLFSFGSDGPSRLDLM